MRPPQVLVCRFVGLHLTALSAVSEGYIRTEYILALNSIPQNSQIFYRDQIFVTDDRGNSENTYALEVIGSALRTTSTFMPSSSNASIRKLSLPESISSKVSITQNALGQPPDAMLRSLPKSVGDRLLRDRHFLRDCWSLTWSRALCLKT